MKGRIATGHLYRSARIVGYRDVRPGQGVKEDTLSHVWIADQGYPLDVITQFRRFCFFTAALCHTNTSFPAFDIHFQFINKKMPSP
jgi:hypothetical protein